MGGPESRGPPPREREKRERERVCVCGGARHPRPRKTGTPAQGHRSPLVPSSRRAERRRLCPPCGGQRPRTACCKLFSVAVSLRRAHSSCQPRLCSGEPTRCRPLGFRTICASLLFFFFTYKRTYYRDVESLCPFVLLYNPNLCARCAPRAAAARALQRRARPPLTDGCTRLRTRPATCNNRAAGAVSPSLEGGRRGGAAARRRGRALAHRVDPLHRVVDADGQHQRRQAEAVAQLPGLLQRPQVHRHHRADLVARRGCRPGRAASRRWRPPRRTAARR